MYSLERAEAIAAELREARERWIEIESRFADAVQDAAINGASVRDLEAVAAGFPTWSRSHLHRGMFFQWEDIERDLDGLSGRAGWLSEHPARSRAIRLAKRIQRYQELRRPNPSRWQTSERKRYRAAQEVIASADADDAEFLSAVRRMTHPNSAP